MPKKLPRQRLPRTSAPRTAGTVRGVALAIGLGLLLSSCGGGDGAPAATATPAAVATPASVLVVLGDSNASGQGDPSGVGWAGQYAKLIQASGARPVTVRSLAVDGSTSAQLLSRLRSEQRLQSEIASASVITLGLGGGDLNLADDALLGGGCEPHRCYQRVLDDYSRNIEAIAARIAALRAGRPVVLRAITLPNFVPGAEDVIPPQLVSAAKRFGVLETTSLRDSTCAAMRRHGGGCIDVMSSFNGPDGRGNAYRTGLLNHETCCYPSTAGQQRMARMLMALGTDPTVLH